MDTWSIACDSLLLFELPAWFIFVCCQRLGNRKREADASQTDWRPEPSQFSDKTKLNHVMHWKHYETLALDLSWPNCRPGRRVSAPTEREFCPGESTEPQAANQCGQKGPELCSWTAQGEVSWKLLQLRLILRRPDRSLHTRWAHRCSAAPGHKRCDTRLCTVHGRQVFVRSVHLGGGVAAGPPPFVFRHSAFLGILLWISNVCTSVCVCVCVCVKASESTRCEAVLEQNVCHQASWQVFPGARV